MKVTFSGTVLKKLYGATKWRYYHDGLSGLQGNLIISETMHNRGEVTTVHDRQNNRNNTLDKRMLLSLFQNLDAYQQRPLIPIVEN